MVNNVGPYLGAPLPWLTAVTDPKIAPVTGCGSPTVTVAVGASLARNTIGVVSTRDCTECPGTAVIPVPVAGPMCLPFDTS